MPAPAPNAPKVPPILHWLLDQENLAADEALAAALPDWPAAVADALSDTLLSSESDAVIETLVSVYQRMTPDLRRRCTARASHWFQNLGRTIKNENETTRVNTVALINEAHDPRLAYLLAIALRDGATRIRAAAAEGLRAVADAVWTEGRLADAAQAARDAKIAAARGAADAQTPQQRAERFLLPAIVQALESFPHHHRTEVLEPVIWYFDTLQPRYRALPAGARVRIDWAMNDVMQQTPPERTGAFAMLGLKLPELRPRVSRFIASTRERQAAKALTDYAWLTGDAAIWKMLHSVHKLAWIEDGSDAALVREGADPDKVVRFIRATGMTPDRQVEFFRRLLQGGAYRLQRAALWALVDINTPDSTQALKRVIEWEREEFASIAMWELMRRCPEDLRNLLLRQAPGCDDRTDWRDVPFDDAWSQFEQLNVLERQRLVAAVGERAAEWIEPLRLRCKSASPGDRRRAILMIRALCMVDQFAAEILELAKDDDASVRSGAVAATAEIETPAARRASRDALGDDDNRVQANAIEALTDEQVRVQEPALRDKLEHRNNRVRANAVKRLLEMRVPAAAETLLEMLEDTDADHRISALWLVRRLQLRTVFKRIEALAASDPDPRIRSRARRLLEQAVPVHAEPDAPETRDKTETATP